jgi:hypothetical protein
MFPKLKAYIYSVNNFQFKFIKLFFVFLNFFPADTTIAISSEDIDQSKLEHLKIVEGWRLVRISEWLTFWREGIKWSNHDCANRDWLLGQF